MNDTTQPAGEMTNDELLERMGQLIDTADNYLEYTKNTGFTNALPAQMKMDAMGTGLADIRQELFEIYMAAGGTDEWSHRDE